LTTDSAALEILADGKIHSAGDVLERGIALGYFPKTLSRESLLNGLHRYYARAIETNRTPLILQLEGSKFRINRPADDWPAIALDPPPRFIDPDRATAAKAKLTATATARDGSAFDVAAAFEIACCEAFALLGFKTQHYGGHGEPDGIFDAPLGQQATRIVLEAKTATPGGVVSNPSPQEPDKFRAAFNAQLAMMIGPAFTGDTNLEQELKTHAVSLWLVDDVITCLDEQIGPAELLPAFAPGHAADAIADILWERAHGRRKRIAVLCGLIMERAWAAQMTLAGNVLPADAPALTEDALLLLVDDELGRQGVAGGTNRAEVREACTILAAGGEIANSSVDGSIVARHAPQIATSTSAAVSLGASRHPARPQIDSAYVNRKPNASADLGDDNIEDVQAEVRRLEGK
jgi:hypothetical protein